MVLKVLAIGDVANVMKSLSKVTKRSKIHIVNFPKDGKGIFIHEDVDRFDSWKVKDQVSYINKIKDKFDICIVTGTGERIAYLADLNYISYYVGRDIDAPRFIKNSKEIWFTTPLHRLNFLERRFYFNTFKNAIAHVSGLWVFPFLQKFTVNAIRMDMQSIDTELFRLKDQKLNLKKSKFTFFSPVRMGRPKGTDLLWNAIKLCKTDFEVLQVEWFDESTEEEIQIKQELLKEIPTNVKLIPMINREQMPEYYNFSDAVIGSMRIDTWELVEFEGVFSGKPVLSYNNPNQKYVVKDKYIESPFVPNSNKPEDIAKIIDKIVESKDFRENLYRQERDFAERSSDKDWIGDWWDNLFEKYYKKTGGIRKNSSFFSIKIRLISYLLANKLYWKKLKNKLLLI